MVQREQDKPLEPLDKAECGQQPRAGQSEGEGSHRGALVPGEEEAWQRTGPAGPERRCQDEQAGKGVPEEGTGQEEERGAGLARDADDSES